MSVRKSRDNPKRAETFSLVSRVVHINMVVLELTSLQDVEASIMLWSVFFSLIQRFDLDNTLTTLHFPGRFEKRLLDSYGTSMGDVWSSISSMILLLAGLRKKSAELRYRKLFLDMCAE